MPSIRPATPADFPAIERIARQTWPATFGAILSPDQIEYMLNWMYQPDALTGQVEQQGHVFLLLLDDAGEPLGFVSYEPHYRNEPVTKVHKLYLLPDTQGRGLGRMLLDEVSRRAGQQGDTALALNVNRHNRAVLFYERIGFSVTGQEDIDIGNGFLMQDFIMTKPLTRPDGT